MPANLSHVVGPTDLPDYVGVAFRRFPDDGYHAAIVYRGSDRRYHLLHLQNHRDLQDDPRVVVDRTSKLRRWVIVTPKILTSDEGVTIAATVARAHRVNYAKKTIPYSAQYDEGIRFDPMTLEAIRESGLAGMSCATFVLRLFEAIGIRLLEVGACPASREGDPARRTTLASIVLNAGESDSPVQAEYVLTGRDRPRIRPEEVAGVCLEETYPVSFPLFEHNGKLILAIWDSWYA